MTRQHCGPFFVRKETLFTFHISI